MSHLFPSIRVFIAVALSPLFVVLLSEPVTDPVGVGPSARGISPISSDAVL